MADIGTSIRIPASGNGQVPVTSTNATVGNTSTVILAEAPGRISATIVNDSDETIYLNYVGGAAELNKGYRLNANGGTWSTSNAGLFTHRISAICATGGKNITLTYAGQ